MSKTLSNQMVAAGNSAFYDQRWRASACDLHSSQRARIQFICAGLGDLIHAKDSTILDLGCGCGWMAPHLAAFGDVVGVDFSPFGIESAQEHFSDRAKFFLAEPKSASLGLPEDVNFDIVVSSDVIEHVTDHIEFIGQIKKLLKPGGWLILTTPNGNIWNEYSRNRYLVHALQPVENWVSPSRLSQLVRASGFVIERHEGLPAFEYRFGKYRWLQRRLMYSLFASCGLGHKFGRFILVDALYQGLMARVSNKST